MPQLTDTALANALLDTDEMDSDELLSAPALLLDDLRAEDVKGSCEGSTSISTFSYHWQKSEGTLHASS